MTEAEYRVTMESRPLGRLWWWLAGAGIGPGRVAYARVVEDALRADADRRGVRLVGDPMTATEGRGLFTVALVASAIGVGPAGVGDYIETAPADVVDQEGD